MPRIDASDLLARTIAFYRQLASYQDEGFVDISVPEKEDRQKTSFETIYAKPNLFRFKFSSPHPYKPLAHIVTTTICGFDGASSYLWIKPYEQAARKQSYDSLTMSVAGATGISSGSAHNIAQFLIPEIGDQSFAALGDVSLGAEEQIDESKCVEIRAGVRDADVDLSLFVDYERLFVRKWVTRFSSFSSHELRQNIRINQPIERARFLLPD